MKRILPVSIILVSIYFLIFISNADRRGYIFSTMTQGYNDKSILRVVSHREKYCFGACGSINVFQTYQTGVWREITAFRHDDPIAFSNNNLKIENENFFYFWFGWKFGVTTDGGKTWAIWDASEDDLMKKSLNYSLIKNVKIEPDGKGKMFFSPDEKNQNGISFFETEDFGKTWHH